MIRELDDEINELSVELNDSLAIYEKAIGLTIEKIADLKQFVVKIGFKDINEEIHFFKNLKPTIVSKLIYYNAIYKIETKKPNDAKAIRKYFREELKKLKRYFDNNLEFYKYYRTNNSFVDEKLFVLGKHDIKLSLDTVYFETDHRFSTSHDYKAAKIIANDLIQLYLEDQLNNTNYNCNHKKSNNPPLNWTGNKTALTELIYALYSQGVFRNADIKVIAKTFESTFNISLGDFYHTFMELKSRKINRTKFLDSLCAAQLPVKKKGITLNNMRSLFFTDK